MKLIAVSFRFFFCCIFVCLVSLESVMGSNIQGGGKAIPDNRYLIQEGLQNQVLYDSEFEAVYSLDASGESWRIFDEVLIYCRFMYNEQGIEEGWIDPQSLSSNEAGDEIGNSCTFTVLPIDMKFKKEFFETFVEMLSTGEGDVEQPEREFASGGIWLYDGNQSIGAIMNSPLEYMGLKGFLEHARGNQDNWFDGDAINVSTEDDLYADMRFWLGNPLGLGPIKRIDSEAPEVKLKERLHGFIDEKTENRND